MNPLTSATETAVVVQVPEAEQAVREHRLRFDVAASWGVGAHVSVLYRSCHQATSPSRCCVGSSKRSHT